MLYLLTLISGLSEGRPFPSQRRGRPRGSCFVTHWGGLSVCPALTLPGLSWLEALPLGVLSRSLWGAVPLSPPEFGKGVQRGELVPGNLPPVHVRGTPLCVLS